MGDDLKSGGAQIRGQTAGGATYYERVLAGSRSADNRCYAGHRRLNGLQKAKPPPIRSSGGLLAIQPRPSLLLPRHAFPGLAKPCPSQASPNPTYPTEPTEPQTPIAAKWLPGRGRSKKADLSGSTVPRKPFLPHRGKFGQNRAVLRAAAQGKQAARPPARATGPPGGGRAAAPAKLVDPRPHFSMRSAQCAQRNSGRISVCSPGVIECISPTLIRNTGKKWNVRHYDERKIHVEEAGVTPWRQFAAHAIGHLAIWQKISTCKILAIADHVH
jgi:hypothetical protein